MAAPFDDESFVPAQAPAVRVQILATEHWGLLAARSMTWSEVMSRITIHLTVASAALVVLALVVQSSGFGTGFHVLSIGLAAVVLILGTLTGVRVRSASIEDRAAVIGMNRLRAAYVSLDPTLADYLVTSWHDDLAGVMRSTTLGTPRHPVAHVLGSTNLFMTAVNTIVAGTLGALIASAAGGNATLITVAGLVAAIAYLAAMLCLARRRSPDPTWPSSRRGRRRPVARSSSGPGGPETCCWRRRTTAAPASGTRPCATGTGSSSWPPATPVGS